MLPVLPEPEGTSEQDTPADEEGEPGPAPRTPRVPICKRAPEPRGKYPEPVADSRGDATDQAVDQAAARQQRRSKRKASENESTPAAGKRDIQQLPGLPGLRRRLRAFSRCYGRGGSGGRRNAGVDSDGSRAIGDWQDGSECPGPVSSAGYAVPRG